MKDFLPVNKMTAERSNTKKEGKVKKPRFGMVLKTIPKNAAAKGILVFIIAYVVLFFILGNRLLITPDLDRSDAFHLNISFKHYLARTLANNSLPFWTDSLQGGFPLFAEGQTGALFLPNLIFLKLFAFPTAYNLLLVFSLFLISTGFYLFLISLSVTPVLAFLYSIVMTFQGSLGFRLIHLNVIQTFSVAPLLFYFLNKWFSKQNSGYFLIIPFLISQMFFAGHLQIAFIVLFALIGWCIAFQLIRKGRSKEKLLLFFHFMFLIATGLMLASPQLIPTFVLTRYSTRSLTGSFDFVTSYSFPLRHILSLFIPYPYGNPRTASYPEFPSDMGIFWENSPYVGSILLILTGTVLLYLIRRKKAGISIFIHIFLSFIFLILAFGKSSPLYFIFDVFPFNLFRTPSKYLLITVFFLLVSSALVLQSFIVEIQRNWVKKTVYILILINASLLIYITFSYNLFSPARTVLKPPDAAKYLSPGRYLSLGYEKIWHDTFAQKGWSYDNIRIYQNLNGFIIPNSNLIWNLENIDINTGGLRLRRMDFINALLVEALSSDAGNNSSAYAKQLLSLNNINHILSSKPLSSSIGSEVKRWKQDGYQIILTKLSDSDLKGYYIPKKTELLRYVDSIDDLYKKGSLSTDSALIEIGKPISQENRSTVLKEIKNTDTQLIYRGTFLKKTFVVFKKNWYPEWEVRIDGKKTIPYRTNLIHIGANIPAGMHTIELLYRPKFFYYGVLLLFSAVFLLIITYTLKKIKTPRL